MSYLADDFLAWCKKNNADIDFKMPCVDITEVAHYIQADPNGKFGDFMGVKDFPCVRPPFDDLWCEYRWESDRGKMGMGFVVKCDKKKESDRGTVIVKFVGKCNDVISLERYAMLVDFNEQGEPIIDFDLATGSKNFIRILDFMADSSIGGEERQAIIKAGQEWGDVFSPTVGALFLAFSFISCKNVQAVVERDANHAINKKRERNGKPPLTKIYTLKIDGIKRLFQRETGSSSFSQNAYHLCRGHFKDFSHGGGLFGKYTGRYWWQSQTRGSKSAGEVIKDYAVKP